MDRRTGNRQGWVEAYRRRREQLLEQRAQGLGSPQIDEELRQVEAEIAFYSDGPVERIERAVTRTRTRGGRT